VGLRRTDARANPDPYQSARMNRFASLVVLLALPLLAALVGTAHAQMATADLVPAAPRIYHPFALGFSTPNIAPENPAALAWGAPSRVAAGMLDGTVEDNQAPFTSSDVSGNYLGGRFVGPTFGFALERQSTKQDSAGFVTEDTSSELQASLRVGEWLALGLGMGDYSRDAGGFVTDIGRIQYGATVRLAEVFYVGVLAFKDSLEQLGTSTERSGTGFGLALRTQGPWQWYLAYDALDLPDFPVVTADTGFKSSTVTAQVNAGGFLLGVSKADVTRNYDGGGPSDITSTNVDVGWVPMAGFALSLRNSKTDLVDNIGFTTDESVKFTALAVSWLF
jgi:hypothetical protein